MTDFEKAMKFTFEHECVYVKGHWGDMNYVKSENHAKDPGGLTKYGIDKRSHPNVDIENLTQEQATEIYRKEYWDKYHCDQLEWPLNHVHFDNCINAGGGQAIKFLQRVCQTVDDGAWGPNTKAAVTAACKVRGTETVALQVIEAKREFYKALAKKDPEQYGEFEEGWLNRTNDLKETIV